MSVALSITERAAERARQRRGPYRASGAWTAEPIDVVADAARAHAGRTALIGRGGELSFGALDQRVWSAVGALAARGIAPGDPVLLVIGNDDSSVVAVHAALRLGAVALLAPLTAGRAHIAAILAETGVAVGVAPGGWIEQEGAGVDSPCAWFPASTLVDAPSTPVRSASRRPGDEPALVLFTSGTTSRPKGVIHSLSTLHKASVNYIKAAGLGAEDRIFLVSPLASVTGVLQGLLIGPMLGVPVILEDQWEPASTYDLLVESGGTWYGGPDLLLDRLLDEAVRRGAGSVPLTAVYLGGTMLDRRVVDRVERAFGVVVMRAYGSSEVPISTAGLRSEPAALRHADDGVALDDVEVRVGSADDPGECCISGPHAFLGYVSAEDDRHAFTDGYFCTGDLAELNDGRLRIVGRIRDIVIRNGLKIPIAEVESAINALPGVTRAAGFSVADAATGEHLAIAVILEDGAALTLDDTGAALTSAGLAKYKLPEELVFWAESFPENATGKVERAKVEALSADRPRVVAERLR